MWKCNMHGSSRLTQFGYLKIDEPDLWHHYFVVMVVVFTYDFVYISGFIKQLLP